MTNPAAPAAAATAALIDAAIKRIDASPVRKGWWSYYADEIETICFVTTKELAQLGSLLADPWTKRDAYSHWCTSVPTRKRLPSR